MNKPNDCIGCPLYGDGKGFVPDEIIEGAKVTVYLQNPGEKEEKEGKPAIGKTGERLNDILLPLAGLERGKNVNVCNAIRCRWKPSGSIIKTNDLPTGVHLKKSLDWCARYDAANNVQLIVAAGNIPLQKFTKGLNVTEWRGYLAPNNPNIYITNHPADAFRRDPKSDIVQRKDWSKIPDILSKRFPADVPSGAIFGRNSNNLSSFINWATSAENEPYIVCDTEYNPNDSKLSLLGLYSPLSGAYQIFWQDIPDSIRMDISKRVLSLSNNVPFVFQNAMADIPILRKNLTPLFTFPKIEDTMLAHAVLWSEMPHTLEFLASIYGKYPKLKHLARQDLALYNKGDLLETDSVYCALSKEMAADAKTHDIYRQQSLPLVPILIKAMDKGLRTNQAKVEEHFKNYTMIKEESNNEATAIIGRPFNLGSGKQLKDYLYGDMGYAVQKHKDTKKPSTDDDALAVLSSLYDDPILVLRTRYSEALQILSHYILPLKGHTRVYPQFKIHAQASGRWSTTDPPMAQLPAELRDLVLPDIGETWIGWDWDAIELRLLAYLADDKPTIEALNDKTKDIHTEACKALFGWASLPSDWVGKDDIRRVFAKRFVYRLNYGGEPKTAGDIPGAKSLGLTPALLVEASRRYLRAHPSLERWRRNIADEALAKKESRTFTGRRRRFLDTGKQAIIRAAYNHPMQGGVSDILNLTIIKIMKEVPDATLAYTMHDSAWISVPNDSVSDARLKIKDIVTQEWNIEGNRVIFPATFKERTN